MYLFEQTCRPVIFETTNTEWPYWGKGSSFLVANAGHHYWITARHVIENLGGSAESLRIFPSDNSRMSLPFNEKYTMDLNMTEDEDYKDIFMLRVDLRDFERSGDAPLIAQDVEVGFHLAESLVPGNELFLIAYPSESRFIDYEKFSIKNTRSVLRAVYEGSSVSDHCHTLRIETSVRIDDFDGLSGGPVFFLQERIREQEVEVFPLFVGLAIRGSAASSTVHFISSNVVSNFIRSAEAA